MSKILIDEEVVRQALEALEDNFDIWTAKTKAVTALREALANAALDKMAENARELGLSYEQPIPSTMKQAIIEEASIQMTGHPSKDARCFAKSVYEYLMAEQPAPAQPMTDEVRVPLEVLEAAESSLGSFCSDEGWSDQDMQNMDNLSAYIARHKAAHGITKGELE